MLLDQVQSPFVQSAEAQRLALSLLPRFSPGQEWLANDVVTRVLLAPPSSASTSETTPAFLDQDPRCGAVRTSLLQFLTAGPLSRGWQTQSKDRLNNLTPTVNSVCPPPYHEDNARLPLAVDWVFQPFAAEAVQVAVPANTVETTQAAAETSWVCLLLRYVARLVEYHAAYLERIPVMTQVGYVAGALLLGDAVYKDKGVAEVSFCFWDPLAVPLRPTITWTLTFSPSRPPVILLADLSSLGRSGRTSARTQR